MKDTRRDFERIYRKMQSFVTPKLNGSQLAYEQILDDRVNPDLTWLDLGCGHQLLPEWRAEEERRLIGNCKTVVGIDYDLSSLKKHQNISLRVRGDITQLPFKDACFDLVTANMVVEHLNSPDRQFEEISRILNPGGIFIFHTPNAHGYFSMIRRATPLALKNKLVRILDGRKEGDVFDVHYKANTRGKIVELAKAVGLEVVEINMLVTDAVFEVIPPLALVELVWIRALMTKTLEPIRTNIIAILKKQATEPEQYS